MSILVIGSSNTDLTIHTEKMPRPGETVLGNGFIVNAGGKGANQAVGAARLGTEVTFSCMIGDDQYGKDSSERFRMEGIDTSYVFVNRSSPSGVALITIDGNGENCIVVAGGANGQFSPEDVDRIDNFSTHSIVLSQLEIPLETVIHIGHLARRHKIPFVLNPAPAQKLPPELLGNIDIITPNETEAEILTGIKVTCEESAEKAAQSLCKSGVKTVIITMGSKGAFLYENGKGIMTRAFKAEAVDTTAAGDIFNGALCAALSEGRPTADAVKFAAAASAIAVTRHGAQSSAPYRNEVENILMTSTL